MHIKSFYCKKVKKTLKTSHHSHHSNLCVLFTISRMVVFARRPATPEVEVSAALRGTGEAGPGGHSPGGHLRDGEGAVDRLWQSRLHVSDHQDSRHLPLDPEPVQCILLRTVASSVLQINPYSQYSLNDLIMVFFFFQKKKKSDPPVCWQVRDAFQKQIWISLALDSILSQVFLK